MIALPTQPKSRKFNYKSLILVVFLSFSPGHTALARSVAGSESVSAPSPAYADVADLVTASPLVIKARIAKRKKVNVAQADPGAEPLRYYLMTAEVESLIRGDNGVAPTLTFLIPDVPKGTPRPDYMNKKATVLLFARPGERPGEIQLISRNAIQSWTGSLEATVRSITAELLQGDSAPTITGIGGAFHIAGTVAGESETQIFLKTSTGAPVSLSILRRPGQAPRWGVSLGEIVDESAAPPARDTLLWYRLACGLPPGLPSESTRSLPMLDAQAARRDYKLVLESLGSCGRTL